MTSTKILLNEIKSDTDLNKSKIKDTKNNKFSIDVSLLEKHFGINDIVKFTSHFNQMKSSSPKSHGKIFIENNKQIKLWEPIKDFIISKF